MIIRRKKDLTAKQAAFVEAYCSNGYNGTQAAITAGYAAKNANNQALQTLQCPQVKEGIDAYKATIARRHAVTVDSLVLELEEARLAALAAGTAQCSAAVAATMGKAKLCGLDVQVVDHLSSDGSMTPKGFNDFYDDDEEA